MSSAPLFKGKSQIDIATMEIGPPCTIFGPQFVDPQQSH